MAASPGLAQDAAAVGKVAGASRALADAMPRLVLEARRVAATIIHGLHGRRRAGTGENFWQYRRFISGESAASVDWRRSARDEHLYVREQEWEAAHTVWLWTDRSPSMHFVSTLATDTKLERALLLTLALAEILVHAGERVGIPGLMPPTANRNVIDKIAQAIVHDTSARTSLPPDFSPAPQSEFLLLSDFWTPLADIASTLAQLTAAGAAGHVVQVVDPAEETFPYSGRVEFIEPEGGGAITAGRAETWREDYAARVDHHRREIRAVAQHYGLSFIVHRTDRMPSELLLQLHARLSAGRDALGGRSQRAVARPVA